MVDTETRSESIYNKLQRTNGLLAVLCFLGEDGPAFRTASYKVREKGSKKETLFEAAMYRGYWLVGVYDNSIPIGWLLDDMKATVKEMKGLR